MDIHPVDAHVGKRIRIKRTVMGISQEALARAIGVSFQQVQKYERGANRLSASRLYEVARYLHVPVSYFFEGLDGEVREVNYMLAEPDQADYDAGLTQGEVLEMAKAFRKISNPSTRRNLMQFIRSVANNDALIE